VRNRRNRRLTLSIAGLALFAAGYAAAGRVGMQARTPDVVAQEYARLGEQPTGTAIAASLAREAAQPANAPEAASALLLRYTSRVEAIRSAPQATQLAAETSVRLQALQVAQNARIIALLEKLANAK
jgi:hypothetical protein